MISCRLASSFLLAAAAVTGCGSSPAPAHHTATTATASPSSTAGAAQPAQQPAAISRYVDAGASEGVEVVRLPHRLGIHETRLVNLTPGSLTIGKPRKATVGEIDIGTGLAPAGVTVHAANASFECGAPFLAVPGHGYRVRCTITASRPGTVKVTLTEHNPRTGAAGSRFTAHARAR